MTLEELKAAKESLGAEITKLIREFEDKYNCHAEVRQNSITATYSQVPRTLIIAVEVHL